VRQRPHGRTEHPTQRPDLATRAGGLTHPMVMGRGAREGQAYAVAPNRTQERCDVQGVDVPAADVGIVPRKGPCAIAPFQSRIDEAHVGELLALIAILRPCLEDGAGDSMAKRTPQPQQLELALPLHESMRLREELTRTQQALATTREELADVRAEAEQWAHHLHRLDRERHALLRERDRARMEVSTLQCQLHATRLLLDLAGARARGTPAAVPAWLVQEVRALLALAHPDKWSAGQEAVTLAHELTVRLNGLRQQLGEGH